MGGCRLCLLETEGEKNAFSGGGRYLLFSQLEVLACAWVLQASAFRYLDIYLYCEFHLRTKLHESELQEQQSFSIVMEQTVL